MITELPQGTGSQGKAPLVSIGLPVYNGQKYLEGCISNLLEQTWVDFELIISDNASTDGTAAICAQFAARDPRVRYHRHDFNRGASWNFNKALSLARGRFFRWAAYDDLISPEYVEVCVNRLEADQDIILCYGLTVIIDADGAQGEIKHDRIGITHPQPSARFKEYLNKVGLTNAIYGLMRIEVLRATSHLPPYPGSDMVLLGELALHGRFREDPSITFFRRIHPLASQPANPSLSQLMAWVNPSASDSLVLTAWDHLLGYISAIGRCPAPLLEKARCLAVLLVWKRHGWRQLVKELIVGARYKFSRHALPKSH